MLAFDIFVLSKQVQSLWPLVVAAAAGFSAVRLGYRGYKNDLNKVHQEIMKELTPNHGSSIKDQISRIETRQVDIGDTLQDVRDIAKRAEDMGHANAVRLNALVSSVEVGFFETNSHGAVTRVNERFCEIFGITKDEALASNDKQLIHPDDKEMVQDSYRAAIASNSPFVATYRFHRKDEDTWNKATIRSYPCCDGGYVGTIELL